MKAGVALAALLLAGCSPAQPRPDRTPEANTAAQLEAAAIEAGVIPDPNATDISGLYARETDRLCVVPSATAYRIGVVVDYGDRQHCGGSGTVTRKGETLQILFDRDPKCRFDARFEGDRIVFPGRLPAACQSLCVGRASLAALAVDRLSDSVSEASTLRDSRGRLVCGADE